MSEAGKLLTSRLRRLISLGGRNKSIIVSSYPNFLSACTQNQLLSAQHRAKRSKENWCSDSFWLLGLAVTQSDHKLITIMKCAIKHQQKPDPYIPNKG